MRKPIAALALLAAIVASASAQTEPDLQPMSEATAEALFDIGMMPFEDRIESEDFTLTLLDGSEASLSDYRGSFVFLNFWATWCPPCREEMPSMQALYEELADEGLEILAVNVLESRETAAEFVEAEGFTYPVMLDTDGRTMLRYGVRAYPTTYLIDREGYVIGVRPGYHDWTGPGMVEGMRTLVQDE
jgi:cytochrome c-type biogenesis protein